MKRLLVLGLFLFACGAPQKPAAEPVQTTSAAITAAPTAKDAAALDPLSGGAIEEASIPKIELTPAKELRAKSRADFDAAMGIVKHAATVEDAAKKITARLGKPTWTENGKKRIWIAKSPKGCDRFILDADGEAEIESVVGVDWRMLAATADLNACTGEIRRGMR
jgi:hypothetical protein